MSSKVNPAVAILVVAAALGAVWFFFTCVFTGQHAGYVGAPPGMTSLKGNPVPSATRGRPMPPKVGEYHPGK